MNWLRMMWKRFTCLHNKNYSVVYLQTERGFLFTCTDCQKQIGPW